MLGWAASMTNTGFVALPILRATYGAPAVLPAAIATVFVAVVMFPAAVLMQELDPHSRGGSVFAPAKLARHVILNPMVLSTLVGDRLGCGRRSDAGTGQRLSPRYWRTP